MPTPEEIKKKIEFFTYSKVSDFYTLDEIEDMLTEFVDLISKDYCIVPKSKVKEVMKYPQRHTELIQGTMHFQVIGIKKAMIDIFGKSLFEE